MSTTDRLTIHASIMSATSTILSAHQAVRSTLKETNSTPSCVGEKTVWVDREWYGVSRLILIIFRCVGGDGGHCS